MICKRMNGALAAVAAALFVAAAGCESSLDESSIDTTTAEVITNSDFETPYVGPTGYQYQPTGNAWTFGPATGVTGKQSAFTNEPNGNLLSGSGQVAFIQGALAGGISQTTFLTSGQYIVAMWAAQRTGPSQQGSQVLSIKVGGVERGVFKPSIVPRDTNGGSTAQGNNKNWSGDLQAYSTAPFTISSSGNYTLNISGQGSGADFTAFIDHVGIYKVNYTSTAVLPVVDVNNGGSTCQQSLAKFSTDFSMVDQQNIAVRHMKTGIINGNPGWYDASVNTLLGPKANDCDRGPYSTRPPFGNPDYYAQSTFQQLGTQGGFLILWQDAAVCNFGVFDRCPHAAFTKVFQTNPPAIWSGPGDYLDIQGDLRMTMVNKVGSTPVVQYYFAFNVTDTTTGAIVPWSVTFYDSRTLGSPGLTTCDSYPSNDGVGNPFAMGFVTQNNTYVDGSACEVPKFVTVASDSNFMRTASSGPDNGAWSDLRKFHVKITSENLQQAITYINAYRPANNQLSTVVSNYRLQEAAILHEVVWDDPDAVDSASSWRNFSVTKYSANAVAQ